MRLALSVATVAILLPVMAVAEEHRELGPHEHGHSNLAVAIEGNRVSMELTAPGVDIVGFEHAAETPEQKAAVEQAEAQLAKPLALFVLPAAAGCSLADAKVSLGSEAEHEGEVHADADADEHEGGHTEFHATYTLDCSDPLELGSMTFVYFDHFPGAQEVEVTMLTERGQSSYEVTRAAPRLALDASM